MSKIELKIDDVVVFSNETNPVPAEPVATDVIPDVQTDAPGSPATDPTVTPEPVKVEEPVAPENNG